MAETRPTEILFIVEEAPEGGYTAHAAGVPIFTQSDSEEGLREAVRDAVQCHYGENAGPQVLRLHFVRDELIAAKS